MDAKGIYKKGNIWWIRFKGPDDIKKFESSLAKRKNEIQERKYAVAKRIGRCSFNELADKYDNFVKKQRSYPIKKCLCCQSWLGIKWDPVIKVNGYGFQYRR